jgi:hypothetical protein
MNVYSCVRTLAAGFVVAASLGACGDDGTVLQVPENRPPSIILAGPDYDTANPVRAPLPSLWVVATDQDGAEDIAAVMLRVSHVTLNSVIVRPDDSAQECRQPYYADGDTINILPYLEKTTFHVEHPIARSDGGTYTISPSYRLLTEGGLVSHSSVLGQWVKACRWGRDYLYMLEDFGIHPPALSRPRDAYVTYADVSLRGITVTVYDQSGASATQTFPDFRGIFTNSLEEATLP